MSVTAQIKFARPAHIWLPLKSAFLRPVQEIDFEVHFLLEIPQ
jgi:hypothetical protein